MTLQVRLASHIDLSNPLVDEVKQNYSDVFFMTKEILANMEAFSQATISDDEIVYVCLHFLAAIERRKKTINSQYWRFVRQDLGPLKC
ncbi:MAG: PRD domain-containing protein [Streptococcus sp.]